MGPGTEGEKSTQSQEQSFLMNSPLNRNNSLGIPAGVHMLLITVGYLALQNDRLLNGLLMVIGFSLSFLMICSFLFVVDVWPACVGEDVRFSGAGVTGSCELPCKWLDLNISILKEQPVLLTTEPSL